MRACCCHKAGILCCPSKRETTDTYNIFTLGTCQKLARGGEGGEKRGRGREGKGKGKGEGGEGEGEGDSRGGGGDFQ